MRRRAKYGEGRAALIESAVFVGGAQGLRGLTFRAVAERAQVNNSLVVRHFGNRESLLAAALDWSVEQLIETTKLLDVASEEVFTEALIESLKTTPELHAFQFEMILEARRNPVYQVHVDRLYRRYQETAEAALTRLGITDDLEAVARHTFAALDGLVMQSLAGVGPEAIRAGLHDLWTSLSNRVADAEVPG